MNSTLALYQRFAGYPFGSRVFSRGLTLRAPYFSTIHPHVTQLRPGYCRVEIKERRSIRNHLGTIHAGAMCTLSELTGGLAVDASLHSTLRWIPKEMTVRYTKKARGRLVCECSLDPDLLQPGDVSIPLEIKDEMEDTVLSAEITFYISKRKSADRRQVHS
jgi:acyl-coenzyme A thioesterase PaaI-like protein